MVMADEAAPEVMDTNPVLIGQCGVCSAEVLIQWTGDPPSGPFRTDAWCERCNAYRTSFCPPPNPPGALDVFGDELVDAEILAPVPEVETMGVPGRDLYAPLVDDHGNPFRSPN